MDNFEFRGQKIGTNEWVYGCLVNNLWCYAEGHNLAGISVCEIITNDEECSDYEEMQSNEQNVTVEPSTVGLFSFTRDRSGNKIFQGDIVKKTKYPFEIFEVKFEGGKFNTCYYNPSKLLKLGNIHENPELLNS